jgi:tRNA-specific 2-thiouridylase
MVLRSTPSGSGRAWGFPRRKPLYVIELDAENNRVVVGDDSALDRDEFTVQNCNWIPWENPPASIEVTAKIRYNHPGTSATVTPLEQGRARVKLHTPQRAVTPGQASVFYQDDLVVGGGWICRGSERYLAWIGDSVGMRAAAGAPIPR